MTDAVALSDVERAIQQERLNQAQALIRQVAEEISRANPGVARFLEAEAKDLWGIGLEIGDGVPVMGICRVCGCTELNACEGGCSWTDDDQSVCSACAAEQAGT